jgi:hypothetical protein
MVQEEVSSEESILTSHSYWVQAEAQLLTGTSQPQFAAPKAVRQEVELSFSLPTAFPTWVASLLPAAKAPWTKTGAVVTSLGQAQEDLFY